MRPCASRLGRFRPLRRMSVDGDEATEDTYGRHEEWYVTLIGNPVGIFGHHRPTRVRSSNCDCASAFDHRAILPAPGKVLSQASSDFFPT